MVTNMQLSATYAAPRDRKTQAMEYPKDVIALTISQANFFRFQFGIVTVLVVLGALHYIYSDAMGQDLIARASSMFDPGREDSIPTAFSAVNLLVGCGLSFLLYLRGRSFGEPKYLYWMILSMFFLAMAIDEVAGIHERASQLQEFTGDLIPVTPTYAWLPYGAALACIVFIFFVPFLAQLKRRTATLLVLSGAIFVAGAMGFEFLNGWLMYKHYVGNEELIFDIIRLFEEGFELYGIALFNCVLFESLASNKFGLTVHTTS